MPLQRYLCVEGVLDDNGIVRPVTNPHLPPLQQGATARYVGAKLKAVPDKDPISRMSHYEPARDIIVDHADLRRAVKNGDLTLHGITTKNSHAEAAAHFAAQPAASEKPRDRGNDKTKGGTQ